MSISVLSISAQLPAGNASAAPFSGDLPLPGNGLPIDFAALLGGQLAQLPAASVSVLQGNQGANHVDKKGVNLPSLPIAQWPEIRAKQASRLSDQVLTQASRSTDHGLVQASRLSDQALIQASQPTDQALIQASRPTDQELIQASRLSDQGLIPETPLAAPASAPEILTTVVDHKLSEASSAEKGRGKALEHANQNARFLRDQVSEPNIDAPPLTATPANQQEAAGVLAMLAPQPRAEQAKSREDSEQMLAAIDPALVAQTLPPYQNATLENRRPIDVDRNKQPSFVSLSEPVPAEKPLPPPQSNLDLKSPGAENPNPRAMMPQSVDTAMANADPANLAAPSASTGNSAPPVFASLMANHAQNASQAPVATSSPTIATALQDSRWPQEFSDRIVWIAKNDQQVAQINITPAQLGPVQITVNLNGDQASINFASPHAEVRKAIEDALPNLREMLASSGINLGQSNVGAQLQQQQREFPGQFANGTRAAGENAILPADSRTGSISSSLPIQRGRGLVDLFA